MPPISLPLWRSVAHVPQMAVLPSVRRISGRYLSFTACGASRSRTYAVGCVMAKGQPVAMSDCATIYIETKGRICDSGANLSKHAATMPLLYSSCWHSSYSRFRADFHCAARWERSCYRANPSGQAGNLGRSVRPGGPACPRQRHRAVSEELPRPGVPKAPARPAQGTGSRLASVSKKLRPRALWGKEGSCCLLPPSLMAYVLSRV